jgi:hypothetical protein
VAVGQPRGTRTAASHTMKAMYIHSDLTALLVANRRRDLEQAAAYDRLGRRAKARVARQRTVANVLPTRPRRFRLLQLAKRRPRPASAT